MTGTILVFGDSNTHGSPPTEDPGTHRRFAADTRWPQVAATALGAGWEIVEEGLPGRTTGQDDPVMGTHMNGQTGLRIALESHGPIDLLVIMLGTNDAKTRFAPTADRIAAGIAGLVDIALGDEMQMRHGGFAILVICPPAVTEQGPLTGEFLGASALWPALPHALRVYCEARGVHFFDAGEIIATSDIDGVHFEADGHRTLGENIAHVIAAL